MIYIKDTSIASDVYFPRLGAAAQYVGASGYIDTRLELTHTITRQTRTEGGMVEPCGDYLLAEDFTADPKLSAGEWEYRLLTDATDPVLLSVGIIRVGELPAIVAEQYVKETEYQQYEQ